MTTKEITTNEFLDILKEDIEVINYDNIINSIGLLNDKYVGYIKELKKSCFNQEVDLIFHTQLKYMFKILSDDIFVDTGCFYNNYFYNDKLYKEGFVYIAKQLNEDNIYKIGSTNDIQRRESQFTTGNIYIKIISSIKSSNYKKIEKIIHGVLNHKNISGEWFELSRSDIDMINESFGFTIHIGFN